ncbi:hypothetical protein KGM_210923 [Danaus plexippus plexippus]|uniref:Uncharacterized protein n=1 Tax=Danaus plexippus plexippus TaxID=278856 RepID=A0A212FGC1_DANPL|nr:hypothetical protein KGM_210923 [Danaus plexippus plexippus]
MYASRYKIKRSVQPRFHALLQAVRFANICPTSGHIKWYLFVHSGQEDGGQTMLVDGFSGDKRPENEWHYADAVPECIDAV